MTLEGDFKRVLEAWNRVKAKRWNPPLVLFETIYDMRKEDRGIDFPLRRLLDSKEYGDRIHVYGCPSHMFGRHPFRWNKKVWLLIKVDDKKE